MRWMGYSLKPGLQNLPDGTHTHTHKKTKKKPQQTQNQNGEYLLHIKRRVKEGINNRDKLSFEFRSGALMTLRLFAKAANGFARTLEVVVF